MKHKFECPHCAQRISATPDLFGTIRSCPACEKNFTVPAPAGYVPEAHAGAEAPPAHRRDAGGAAWHPMQVIGIAIVILLGGVTGLLLTVLARHDPPPLDVIYASPGGDDAAAVAEDLIKVSSADLDQQRRLADLRRRLDAQEAAMTELKSRLNQRDR